jgi:quercetin dioxygenase-like cupin family protein
MEVIKKKASFKDKRGVITDIISGKKVDSIAVITSKKGAIRGNHLHKKTTQYTYILAGKFRAYTQERGGKVQTRIVRPGDFVVSAPWESHAFVALEDSTMLACCHGPRAGTQYEDDTYRLDTPITPDSTAS